jgi:insulysin
MQAEQGNRLSEGLNIFGSLFASPLFTASATNRELNAIDSENAKNLQSDSFRIYQLMKARANSDHPFSKFFTGNKKTLLDDTKAQGINLRDELIKFHGDYYSANQMTLALVAPQPLDDLKQMVTKSFSSIPNKNIREPEEAWKGIPPYSDDSVIPSFQTVLEIVPVQDLRQVTLSWPVVYKSNKEHDDSVLEKQSNYVAHLIGHEGPGSLLSYLKRKKWANALGSATQAELADFESFEVTVGLTTAGLGNVDKVIEAMFSYLSMLRNRPIPDYVYQEVLQLNELEWRFLTKGNPGNYVQSLATAMQKYPPSLYVAGPRRLALSEPGSNLLATRDPRTGFSSRAQLEQTKDLVNNFISNLTVENSMVTVMSKTFEGKTDKQEKWYGTNYSVRPVPPVTLEKWRNPATAKSLKIDFPRPNAFIPTEAGMRVRIPPRKESTVVRDLQTRLTPIPPPSIVREDGPGGRWTVHFKEDDRFGQPKAFVIFQLLTPEVFSSPKNAALSNLYEICVSDRLGEYAYDGMYS